VNDRSDAGQAAIARPRGTNLLAQDSSSPRKQPSSNISFAPAALVMLPNLVHSSASPENWLSTAPPPENSFLCAVKVAVQMSGVLWIAPATAQPAF